MRASVDPDLCAGHGACVVTCSDVFALTDDGYAEVTTEEIPAQFVDLVKEAARQCPERAIKIDSD